MEGFAKARHDKSTRRETGKARGALVRLAVKHHVLVNLVADQKHLGRREQRLQRLHIGIAPDAAGRVVRAVDDDGAGARRQRGGDFVKVGPKRAGCQRHTPGRATGQHDVGHVAVVAGVEHDDFVARMDDGQDGRQYRLRGAGGDGDFARRAIGAGVECFYFVSNGLAQLQHAGHGRVLVVAGAHRAVDGVQQAAVAVKVWKALAQIDSAAFGGQRRHGGKDGGADGGQAAAQGGGAFGHAGSKNQKIKKITVRSR